MASDEFHDPVVAAFTTSEIKKTRPIDQLHEREIVDLLVRPKGRPAIDPAYRKQAVSIRLDQDVITFFKADGPGWQTRLNASLLLQLQEASGAADRALGKAMATQRPLATERTVKSDA